MMRVEKIERPRFTAIGSGKGGTGKTLVAASLAHALALEGECVLLCDADFGLSNTTVHLGLKSGGDLIGVLAGHKDVAQAVAPVLGGVKTRGGFDILAAPSGSGALADLGEDAASRLIDALRASRAYDRVLFDLGAGVDRTTLHLAQSADETLLVLTPDPASLTDAYAFAKLLLRASAQPPFLIVNMTASESEARRTSEALIETCRAFLKSAPRFLGTIPRDAHALEAVRQQAHLLSLHPEAAASRAIAHIAARLHEKSSPSAPRQQAFSLR
ncbi:MAG: P-loop NTPase [Rhizomicrobium sp.]